MTVSITVNNPAQTVSLNMLQEQPTQTLALVIADGVLNIVRQPLTPTEMLLFGEGGMAIDFMLDDYVIKS